jgi:hypothetical protein
MSEVHLDGAEVGPALQQVSGKAMPQGVYGHVLVESRSLACLAAGEVHRACRIRGRHWGI